MSALLAAEGGYQSFELGGGEWFWLIFSAVTALIALAVGFYLVRAVNAADTGTDKMREIAEAIQEGAMAYLRRQFKTIAVIVIPLAIIVFVTSTEVVKPTDALGYVSGLSQFESGLFRTLAFLAGCFLSGLTGFIGMSLAVRGNVRTAAAARNGSMPEALEVAYTVGSEEHAGADLADRRSLLVNRNPDILRDQRIGCKQASNATPDDGDVKAGLNHD